MAVYTTIDDPELYFQVKTYTGNGSTQSITLDGDENMQPDIVWIKNRDATDQHCVFNSFRGATKVMDTENTPETTDADTLTSFDSDGFSLGDDVKVNTNTEKYVAWCWKESADAGLDIVNWTGNLTQRNISHNLSAIPEWIITWCNESDKQRTCYHKDMTADPDNAGIFLNSNAVPTTGTAGYFGNTAPTSSVFTIGTSTNVNNNGSTLWAYTFAPIQGFSKFGSYEGNGNADGTFVYTGFKPAMVIFKDVDGTNAWRIGDTKRIDAQGGNGQGIYSFPDTNAVEQDSTTRACDYLSNGFKIRHNDGSMNGSGTTYIYMAWAEAPFVNSNGVPCNAR